MSREIFVGERFGKWTVIGERVAPYSHPCRCDCGKEKIVTDSTLLLGKSNSCGCNRHPVNKMSLDMQLIRRLYVEERYTSDEIGEHLGVNGATIRRRLNREGLTRDHAESRRGRRTREKNHNWKGGRKIHSGYVLVKGESGYIREHRQIMERAIGRKLLPTEIVHHVDEDRQNNAIDNLVLLESAAEHARLHAKQKRRVRTAIFGDSP